MHVERLRGAVYVYDLPASVNRRAGPIGWSRQKWDDGTFDPINSAGEHSVFTARA